jgi:hypothetical protein
MQHARQKPRATDEAHTPEHRAEQPEPDEPHHAEATDAAANDRRDARTDTRTDATTEDAEETQAANPAPATDTPDDARDTDTTTPPDRATAATNERPRTAERPTLVF